jgi:uncharacterized membrane protein
MTRLLGGKNMKEKKLVFTAIFIALVFLTTSIFKIPISLGWGYVHFGDLAVMLSGMLLGPVLGAIAAALGSSLADMYGGFVLYIIPTFIVKGLLAFTVGTLYKNFKDKDRQIQLYTRIPLHFLYSIIIVVGGYFIADFILAHVAIADLEGDTEWAYALFGVIPNLIQVSFGVVSALLFYKPLKKPFDEIYNK